MSETIQMTETAQSIQASIRPAVFQLNLAKSLLQKNGLSTNTIDTAEMLMSQVESMAIELTAQDLDDYDALYEQAKGLEKTIIKLESDVATFKVKAESNEQTNINLRGVIAEHEIQLKLKAAELAEVKEMLKTLRDMQPERLKQNNAKLKKEVATNKDLLNEQRLKIRSLNTEVHDLKKTVNTLNTQNAETVNTNVSLAQEVARLRGMVARTDGQTVQKPFAGANGAAANLEFYIHTLNWPVTSQKAQGVSTILLTDVDWHTMLRTTYGVDALIRFTEWLSPIIPEERFYPLSRYISDELLNGLHEYCINLVESTHPHLIERVEWAKGASLLDVEGLPERHLDNLLAGGIKTVYDVMKSVDGTIEARCKGIGEKAELDIRKACSDAVSAWVRENEDLTSVDNNQLAEVA